MTDEQATATDEVEHEAVVLLLRRNFLKRFREVARREGKSPDDAMNEALMFWVLDETRREGL